MNFIDRWKDYITAGDPYFNRHLTRSSLRAGWRAPEEEDRWNQWHSTLIAR